eukprot:CAMPEP_0114385760 /NCGR_PEP_ID=MMETSP0102-20121206/6214_1 /TAXON_ID=38822 ORGANISM="Pteridomonas danica, Strain PT" /NCGR_SAMPLE_ID=MMETSP0102 /ASSEMBLY_ACC=CAM_ASM_000212 /LENGTH=805 /DNA_ID=CAMNT_0001542449 /DNA_START=666 /DNA_END=3083 /DNA_ORIENTATION=+
MKLEWAVEFSDIKFQTTLQYVIQRAVPTSHVLCYYYTSLEQAKQAIKHGSIPATKLYFSNGNLDYTKRKKTIGNKRVIEVLNQEDEIENFIQTDDDDIDDAIRLGASIDGGGGIDGSGGGIKGQEEDRNSKSKGNVFQKKGTAPLPPPPLPSSSSFDHYEGIMISLKGPMNMKEGDVALNKMGVLASSREAVICLSLPHSLLFKIPSSSEMFKEEMMMHDDDDDNADKLKNNTRTDEIKKKDYNLDKKVSIDHPPFPSDLENNICPDHIRYIPSDILYSMSNISLVPTHISLPIHCCLRAYQLKDDSECISSSIQRNEMIHINPNSTSSPSSRIHMSQPTTCIQITDLMTEIRNECKREGLVPLYHYTTKGVSDLILDFGFRMSTQGQGDGGVYFSTLGPSSYELGSPEYEDNIIIDCFGKERLEEYKGKHKLDVVFIYGINPKIIEQAPGGRENAKMVTKSLFEVFGKTNLNDNCYYLRPDRIKACLLIDGTSLYPGGRDAAKQHLILEKQKDIKNQENILIISKKLNKNSDDTKAYRREYNSSRRFSKTFSLSNVFSSSSSSSTTTTTNRQGLIRGRSNLDVIVEQMKLKKTNSHKKFSPTNISPRHFKRSNTSSSIEQGEEFDIDDEIHILNDTDYLTTTIGDDNDRNSVQSVGGTIDGETSGHFELRGISKSPKQQMNDDDDEASYAAAYEAKVKRGSIFNRILSFSSGSRGDSKSPKNHKTKNVDEKNRKKKPTPKPKPKPKSKRTKSPDPANQTNKKTPSESKPTPLVKLPNPKNLPKQQRPIKAPKSPKAPSQSKTWK